MYGMIGKTFNLSKFIVAAGCFIPDAEVVLKFVGSMANAILNFTFPGLFYFVIMRKHKAWWKLALSMALCIYGTAMGVILTGINVWTTISPVNRDMSNVD